MDSIILSGREPIPDHLLPFSKVSVRRLLEDVRGCRVKIPVRPEHTVLKFRSSNQSRVYDISKSAFRPVVQDVTTVQPVVQLSYSISFIGRIKKIDSITCFELSLRKGLYDVL